MRPPKTSRCWLYQSSLALCGALLYGVITYRLSAGPFSLPSFYLTVAPAALICKCIGAEPDTSLAGSFTRTAAFFVIVNAVVGALLLIVLGNVVLLIIRASRRK